MASHSDTGQCFICKSSLTDGEVATVTSRGLPTLIECSIKRQEPSHEAYLKEAQNGSVDVKVHVACRKAYTNERKVLAAQRRGIPSTSAAPTRVSRSKIPGFDFNNTCFLCDEWVSQEFRDRQAKLPAARRNEVVKVMAEEKMAQSIVEAARKRNDEWGKKIEARIQQLDSFHTDLVAVNAEYHRNCLKDFYRVKSSGSSKTGQKRGRPRDVSVDAAMEIIYSILENNSDECQFSLNQLLSNVDESQRPDSRTVKAHLKAKYGEDIIISESPSSGCIISFTNTGHKILSENWYINEQSPDPQKERLRVVKAAGEIILEDIRSKVFSTTAYPPIDNFLGGVHLVIPETLLLLLHTLILTNKKGSLQSWKNKCLALAHAIMIAVRPRSFLSPIMISVAVYMYKKFGSRHLLNVLSALGFSATYKEAQRLEGSYVLQAEKPKIDESSDPFVQFILDNADFNVQTLDGNDTFHAMGGIMAVTPREAVICETDVARLNVSSASKLIAAVGSVPLIPFHRESNAGLLNVTVSNIQINCSDQIDPSHSEIAWLYGKNSEHSSTVPGWNGFMEQGTRDEIFQCSKIVCLPFVNAPPSDYNTLLTSIIAAMEDCKTLNQKTCILTFDQPLFWKARDIVASVPQLSNVIVRLGGFHLLMSFMGAIGTIMAGSGIKELFSTIFAGNSVDKIMQGHAYARAIRGHILAHAALAGLVFEELTLTDEDTSALDRIINFPDRSIILRAHKDEEFHAVAIKFRDMLKTIEMKGPTAALWVQYFRMCTLMKDFIKAERMGDWGLHLECVKQMIPFFHAAGHLNYAKSAHLYYQDMLCLNTKMDGQEFHKFTTQGYFTIRRTDKFWSGIWSDMTIEQVLMRAMKSYGGLTRGRGVSDSVLSRWTVGMLCLQQICEQVEIFTEERSGTSEQHVDMRPSRVTRDNMDIGKLKLWFSQHLPFQETTELVSLSTGQVGTHEINCHAAREIGVGCMQKIVGQPFDAIKLKRKNKVITLASISNSIKVGGKKITVDPLTLFQRVCISKKSDEDLKELLTFELSPYPMSLFTEEGMRKGTKSALYEAAFTPIQGAPDFGVTKYSVIDGGFLLHKVVWGKTTTHDFHGVCLTYVDYVLKHFGTSTTVVFDGYPDHPNNQSTKAAERSRRAILHSSTRFTFSEITPVTVSQESFLSNGENKKHLIKMIMKEMTASGITVVQATEDADRMIVTTAITKAADHDSVVITGDDVDLLVILTGLSSKPGAPKNIYFQKSGKGKAPSLLYSAASCSTNPKDIMFIHAISGCDTTSTPFGQGKKKVYKLYQKSPLLQEIATTFSDAEASHDQITEAGERFLVALYGGNCEVDSLNSLRFQLFQKSAGKPKFHLHRLPPTKDAAIHHSERTYLQVQTWLGNELVPSAWGWSLTRRGVVPITNNKNAAPDHILTIVSCKCTKGCSTAACTCKKSGMVCSSLCKSCTGHSCENSPEPDLNDEDSHVDDDLEWDVDSLFMDQGVNDDEEGDEEESPLDAKRVKL